MSLAQSDNSRSVVGPDTERLHIIFERDVGLFSLIQQVMAHIPWALKEQRLPIVYFREGCVYWTPNGYAGRDTVWEYYFDPLIPGVGVDTIPEHISDAIEPNHGPFQELDGGSIASAHFGDDKSLAKLTLQIPHLWHEPLAKLRMRTAPLVEQYIRPRTYIREKVSAFFREKLEGRPIIGVHVRGTDALKDGRPFRKGSLVIDNYISRIDALLARMPAARIFLATDEQAVTERLRMRYGERLVNCDNVRHMSGETSATGPRGGHMPAYLAHNRDIAARNGEEAVVDWLLLCKASHLVHNGSGLARTVLLAQSSLPHSNVHLENNPLSFRLIADFEFYLRRRVRRTTKFVRRKAGSVKRFALSRL
jgi:hypothetical protein